MVDVFVAARGSALPMVIPVIIMGGILTGWFTPTEAGMVAAAYILLVLIPVLNPRHIRHLPGDFMYTGLLYSLPLAAVAGASAFGWMLAYLRGPDTVSEYISYYAGTDPRMIMLLLVVLFVILGDFIDAIPAIIIFMPIINKLTQVGHINPVHMGVVIITTLVFGLITPPYGLSLLIASKFVGVPFYRAMFRSLPLYVVFFITIAFTVLFPDVVLWLPKQLLPQSVGCFPQPQRSRLDLPQVAGAEKRARAAGHHRLRRGARGAHRGSAALERVRLASPFVLRSFDPPISEANGRAVTGLRRVGKRIVIALEGDLFLVDPPDDRGAASLEGRWARKVPGKVGLAAFDFSTGTLTLTEAGTKKRAAIHLAEGRAGAGRARPRRARAARLHRGGVQRRDHAREPHAQARADRSAHPQRHRQRVLGRDPAPRPALAGEADAGAQRRRARAALSRPFAPRSTTGSCASGRTPGGDFPEGVTAFRPEMAVHGRYGKPCPDCGAPVQRIRHADNETNYCAKCQTGGKLLADRALSRLLQSRLAAHARRDGGAPGPCAPE